MKLDSFPTKADAIRYVRQTKNLDHVSAEKYLRAHIPAESVYQKKIIDFLRKYPKAKVWKICQGPGAAKGIPDVHALIDGKFFVFEVKRPYFGQASDLQINFLKEVRDAGGYGGIVVFPEDVSKIVEEVFNGRTD